MMQQNGQHARGIRSDCATGWFAVRIDDAVFTFAPDCLAGERGRLAWLCVAAWLRSETAALDTERS